MTIFEVSTTDGLMAALEAAQGNDEIRMASGNYEDIVLKQFSFSSEVTITSADIDNPAVFSSLIATEVSNITFDSLVFNLVPDENTVGWDSALKFSNSSNVAVRNSVFEGGLSVAGIPADSEPGTQGAKGILGEPIGRAVTFQYTDNIVFENNEVSIFDNGIALINVNNATIAQNEVHHLRTSALVGGALNDILVEDNHFHSSHPWNFGGAGDHGDYIHFYTRPGQDGLSKNITIRNNVLEEGDGTSLLGIFLEDSADGIGYSNVNITGNVINTGNAQAIRLEDVDGGSVSNNTLLQSSGGSKDAPGISLHDGVKNLVVKDNIVSRDIGGDAVANAALLGITLSGNLTVQYDNIDAANYFGDLFFDSHTTDAGRAGSLWAVPGSAADGLGSLKTHLDLAPDSVVPVFQVMSAEAGSQTLVFDASFTYGPDGLVAPEGATFLWNFGDGSSATGRIVEHNFATVGSHSVTLQVLVGGQNAVSAATASAVIGISGDDILTFNANNGAFYLQGYGAEKIIASSADAAVVDGAGMALDLGGSGTALKIPKEALSRFFGTDAFEMSMTLQADQPGVSWGEVARVHMSIITSVRENGDLLVRLFPDSGEAIALTSSGIAVNDGAAHDISIVFDGTTNSLKILIDGVVAGSETVTGSMPAMASWGLVFGEPWGGQNFDGKLSAFELEATSVDYPVFEGELEDTITEPGPADPVTEPGPVEPITEPGPVDPITEPGPVEPGPVEPGPVAPIVEPTPVEPTPEPDTDDAGLRLPTLDDFVARFDQLQAKQLHDDAYVVATENGGVLNMDGKKDYADLGHLTEFEQSEQLSFSVDFRKNAPDDAEQRIVWNHQKVGLAVVGDGLKIYVGQADTAFRKAIKIDDLGLDDTEVHQVMVMIDAKSDHMQVIVDGSLVLDMQDRDIDFVGAGGSEWGWSMGAVRNHFFDGEVSDFRIDASAEFVLEEDYVATDETSMMG